MVKAGIEQRLAKYSLGRLLSLTVAAVFISELLVMLLIHLFELDGKKAALADPFLLSLFLLPIFFFGIFRPINDLLVERREYEKNLYQAYDALEQKVQERTEELHDNNENLYREITERKKAEKDLREKIFFLEIIIESLGHPFYVIDAQTYEIKLANRATGFKYRSGKTKCYELTHNRDTPCTGEEGHPCLVKRVVETGESQVGIHTHSFPDGTTKQVEVHTQPIFDEHGKVTSVIEFVMDCSKGAPEKTESSGQEEDTRPGSKKEQLARRYAPAAQCGIRS